MSYEQAKKRAAYAWALYFFEGTLLGVGLPIIPFLIGDRCLSGYENTSDHLVLLVLCGIVTAFYCGRMLSSLLISPWKESRGYPYKFYFAVTSFFVIPALVVFGYTTNVTWLAITRLLTGVLSGYSCNLAMNIESKPYNYIAWVIGLGSSALISGLLYASDYPGQPITTFSTDLEQHPAIIGVVVVTVIMVLVILRVRLRERRVDKTSDDADGASSHGDMNHISRQHSDTSINSWELFAACNPIIDHIERRENSDEDSHMESSLSSRLPSEPHDGDYESEATGSVLDSRHTPGRESDFLPVDSNVMDDGDFRESSVSPSRHIPSVYSTPDTRNNIYHEDVNEEDIVVPNRYLRGCGDYEEALRRWKLTLKWRQEFDVDNVLNEPQPYFDIIKEFYPHFLHGRSVSGKPVYYELLGKIDVPRLQEQGVDVHRLLRYYVFITEYIWAEVEPDDDHGQLVTVLDVQGVGVADLMGDALEFIKEASKVVQSHYVERCHKMFIVNAPFFFNMLWRIISPMLHENTRRKITILGADKSELLEHIDASQLPVAYGGRGTELGTSLEELKLKAFVDRLNGKGDGRILGAEKYPADSMTPSGEASILQKTSSPPYYTPAGRSRVSSIGGPHEPDGSIYSSHSHISLRSGTALDDSMRSITSTGSHKFRYGLGTLIGAIGTVSAGTAEGIRRLSSVIGGAEVPHEAHLGQENSFEYDKTAGKWVLKGSSGTEKVYEDEAEKRLVRAIQAAQGLVDESEFGDEEEEIELYNHSKQADKASLLESGRVHTINNAAITPISGRASSRVECKTSSSHPSHHLVPQVTPNTSVSDSVEHTTTRSQRQRAAEMAPFFTFSLLYIVWRGVLICVLETLCALMFLSDFYNGVGLAPYGIGILLFFSCIMVLVGKVTWQQRLSSSNFFPIRGFKLAVIMVQLPVFTLLFLIPFTRDSIGGGISRMVIIAFGYATAIGCLMVSVIGASTVCDMQPGRVIWLYSRIYLAEAIGAVAGILLMRVAIWLPFCVCVLLTIGLGFATMNIPI